MIEVMPRPGYYPQEVRDRAVRMVADRLSDHPSEWATITTVARELGIGSPETLRRWIRQGGGATAPTPTLASVVQAASEVQAASVVQAASEAPAETVPPEEDE